MVRVNLDNNVALEMLTNRLKYWTDDETTLSLYEKMYNNALDSGCFEDCDFDPMIIVDNDYINNCKVVYVDECPEFVTLYKAGERDVNSNEFGCCYIEVVDDDDNPQTFLIRL